MDQRRFIAFLMLSLAVLMLSSLLFPPPPQPKPAAPAAGDQQPGAEAPAQPGQAPPDEAQQPAQPLAHRLPPAAAAAAPTQLVTLGSLDSNSGYTMLATLTNRGAAVRRVEMSSARFRDLDDRSGYLGELAPRDADGGVEVQVVGPGTPAAQAGLQPHDLIVGVGEVPAGEPLTAALFQSQLSKARPGQQLTLQVRRGNAAPQAMTARLVRRPLAVIRPEIENLELRGADPPEGFLDRPSFLVTLSALAGKPLTDEDAGRVAEWLEDGAWEIAAHDQASVTFRLVLGELNLELTKRYTLQPVPPESRDDPAYPGYHLLLDVALRNTADVPQSLVYRLDGPTGLPIEGWWYAYKISQRWFSAAGLRDVAVRFEGSPEVQLDCSRIAQGKVEPMGQNRALAYAGVDAQYFSAVLIPQKAALKDVWFDTTEAVVIGPKPEKRTPPTYTNVTCRLTRNQIEIPPGTSHRDSYQIFIGPKRPALLAQYWAADDPNYSLKDLIYYGWFGAVARAMLGILHFFYGFVGNYGIAIMMLTVLVRGAMFPVSFKQTQNMTRMQALKPEMDRITEKYKTDMQKRSQAMQDLYRKHNINPLGGCLPLFIQLPIFIGLYRSLMIDVELRQSAFFGHWIHWCSNLAAPDMLLDWSPIMPEFVTHGTGILALGPYLNILPLVTVALFLVTQKMAMPAPTSDQAAMQQKMMKYMTGFMALLFYKVASGLCLYFIASSAWGIAERKLLARAKGPGGTAAPAGPASGGKSSGDGGGGGGGGGSKPGQNGSPSRKKRSKSKRKR